MPSIKIAVIGNQKSGKTQLVNALIGKEIALNYQPTRVFDTTTFTDPKSNVSLQFFDISYDGNSEKIYKNTDILLYCIDVTEPEDIAKRANKIEQLKKITPNVKLFYVYTKCDLVSTPPTNTETIYETSAISLNSPNGIEQLKNVLISTAQQIEDDKTRAIYAASLLNYEQSAKNLKAKLNSLRDKRAQTQILRQLNHLDAKLKHLEISMDEKLSQLNSFTKTCKDIIKDENTINLVHTLAIAAFTVIAAFVGFTLGFALGAWTGPGALFTGLMTGQAAAIALVSCTGLTTAAGGLFSYGLFKNTNAVANSIDELGSAARHDLNATTV